MPAAALRGGGEPADAERIGGQTDQRVDSSFQIGARHREGPAVPAAGPVVPAELTQEGRLRAVRQRRQPADPVGPPDTSEVGVGAGVAALPARDDRA